MPSYLTFPDLSSAQARSAQRALALGCDGVTTEYWWPIVALANGGAALVIAEDGDYGPAGLSAAERAALVAEVTLANGGAPQ
jgi:hypothetical protein